jgi:flagellar hook-length control protein FliK
MTISSIETLSPTASSAKIDFAATPNDPSTRAETSEFGQIMSGVMQSSAEAKVMTAWQEVAASSALQPGIPGSFGGNLGGDFLKAVNLGPHMNVITSEATVPDEQSLEAFARSQGLDETAVQWLMGTNPVITVVPQVTPLGLIGIQPQQGVTTEGAPPLGGTHVLSAINANSQTTVSGQMFKPLSVGGANLTNEVIGANLTNEVIGPHSTNELVMPHSTNGVASPFSSTAPAGEMSATESPVQPTAVNPAATASVSEPEANLLPNTLTAAALWAMTQATEKARIANPAHEEPSEVAKIQINLMASPAPAAFWMLRNPMVTAPNKEPVATSSGVSLSEIDLTQSATPELLDSLSQAMAEGATLNTSAAPNDHPTPLSGHSGHRVESAAAARQDAQNPDASASAPDSGNAQRSEKVQNLAEKMGQAVGQRILSEIEKGQWHLKLSLRPATLGHIEVEMRMRSGELDAIFTAPQAVTRELLQEGMSKLKDTLSQMGMDVASMQVGDGQTQKRGGESTPGQMSKSTETNSDDQKSDLSTDQTPVSRIKMGQDGWDVLV